jgi:predicted amidohydrolase
MPGTRIGVAQVRSYGTIAENAAAIIEFVQEARRQGVRILAFPETALSGYIFEGFATLDRAAAAAAADRVAASLRGSGLTVVLGAPTAEDGTLRNSVLVLGPDGSRVVYHKINLVPFEKAWFTPGTTPRCFDVEGVRFGVEICKDQNSAELTRTLADQGARGLFICAAHYYEPAEARLKLEKNAALPIARAYENGLFVFKANAIGCSRGQVSYGPSMIIDPRGIVVQRGSETREELLCHDIDFGRENPHW